MAERAALRRADESDLERLREIYNHAVEHTLATMDTELRDTDQMATWWQSHSGDRYVALVAEVDGAIGGYGFLSPFASRGGYLASCEISVYLAPEAQGGGLGTLLLTELTDHALRVGFTTVMGFSTSTNVASIRMMKRIGYEHVGLLRDVARKHGQLVSLSIWQRMPREG